MKKALFEISERKREKILSQQEIYDWLDGKIRRFRREFPGRTERVYRLWARRALAREMIRW